MPETSYSLANLATNLSIFKPTQATVRHSHMTDYELEAIGQVTAMRSQRRKARGPRARLTSAI